MTALCVDKEAQEALGKIEIVRTADVDYMYITGADDQFIHLRLFQTRLACMRDE
ncbi:hypothetical protein [Bdellovibrio bacteriovorus]|uniref:hypothetical protein n=1 Tax=Bdellovibrio bacteriovorus TaxID=959 RepID=UPI0035A5CC26